MLYSKISCNVAESLSKMYDYGVYSALDVDFNALMTITDTGKYKINGTRLYSEMLREEEVTKILKILVAAEKENIIGLEETREFSCQYQGKTIDVIYSPVRYYENYFVYSILGKQESKWSKSQLGIVDFITKVTYENVLLDKKVMQERTYLKNVFDSVNSHIVTVDQELQIISINKKVSEDFRLDEACIGKKFLDVACGINSAFQTTAENILDYVKRSLSGEDSESIEEEVECFGCGKKYIKFSVSKMLHMDGSVMGAIIIGNDISPLKIYEKENEQLKQYALLGEISADVAHDIKNPLMSILSAAKFLKKKSDLESLEYLEAIVESANRINKIIEQMLAYSKISTEVKTGKISINEVLEECMLAVMFSTTKKQIEIRKFFAAESPQLDISVLKLQQLFMNILLNSVQSIEEEGKVDIITQVDCGKKEVVVIIKDTGAGMDDADAAFEMFYTTKENGTGLGLSIVKKVILELGGRYQVKSVKGQGTVFYIWLPLEAE